MGDYTYRTREQVALWRERCPIKRFRAVMLEADQATAAELDAIDAEVQNEVTQASQAAERPPLQDTFLKEPAYRWLLQDLMLLFHHCWEIRLRISGKFLTLPTTNPVFCSWMNLTPLPKQEMTNMN